MEIVALLLQTESLICLDSPEMFIHGGFFSPLRVIPLGLRPNTKDLICNCLFETIIFKVSVMSALTHLF